MQVIFVGISNKSDAMGEMQPLDKTTPTGKIIHQIEYLLGRDCIKTNLVQFTPVDDHGKIRYPNQDEINTGLVECLALIHSHSPCVVFLLGKLVQKAFFDNLKTKKLTDSLYQLEENIYLIPVYHPSYIHTYRRTQTNNYINHIVVCVYEFDSL